MQKTWQMSKVWQLLAFIKTASQEVEAECTQDYLKENVANEQSLAGKCGKLFKTVSQGPLSGGGERGCFIKQSET